MGKKLLFYAYCIAILILVNGILLALMYFLWRIYNLFVLNWNNIEYRHLGIFMAGAMVDIWILRRLFIRGYKIYKYEQHRKKAMRLR